jgi:hypothetical protein
MQGRSDFPVASDALNVSRIAATAIVAFGLLFLNKVGLGGTLVFFGVVLLAMLAGSPGLAFRASTLLMLGVCANVAFVPKTAVWTIARFVNLFLFTGRFVTAGANAAWATSPPYVALSAFCGTAFLCSVLSGYYVEIALLKLFNFWIGMTGFFACAAHLRRTKTDTTEWFVVQAIVVSALSVLSMVMGVGSNFARSAYWNERLFNLAFYHPNTSGPLFAQLILYLACVFLFTGYRNRWICIPLAGFLTYCLIKAGSRTGAAALVGGAMVMTGILLVWKGRGLRRLNIRLSRPAAIIAIVAACCGAIVFDGLSGRKLSKAVVSFAAKTGQEAESVTFEGAVSSRKSVVEMSYENFKQSPLTGIGFQVSTAEHFVRMASLFYAPIEKGFLPTALLEEVGIVGTLVFCALIAIWLWHLIAARNAPGVVLFIAFLLMNCGEVSFFAIAGHGAYEWSIIFGAILLGDRCFKPTPLPVAVTKHPLSDPG